MWILLKLLVYLLDWMKKTDLFFRILVSRKNIKWRKGEMKLAKVMIKKHRTEEETSFTYPDGWDEYKANMLAFEDSDVLGDVVEGCIALIHDDDYAQLLIDHPDVAVEEISEKDANVLGAKWRPQVIKIDNMKLPDMLVALAKIPTDRSIEEVDMLNPDKDVEGMRRSLPFDVKRWYPE